MRRHTRRHLQRRFTSLVHLLFYSLFLLSFRSVYRILLVYRDERKMKQQSIRRTTIIKKTQVSSGSSLSRSLSLSLSLSLLGLSKRVPYGSLWGSFERTSLRHCTQTLVVEGLAGSRYGLSFQKHCPGFDAFHCVLRSCSWRAKEFPKDPFRRKASLNSSTPSSTTPPP